MIFTREQLPRVEVANNLTALNSQVLVMMSGHKALLEGRCAGGVLEAAATMIDVDQRITLRGCQHLPFTTVLLPAPPEVAPAVLACVILHWARAGLYLRPATMALSACAHVANDQHKKRGTR